MKKNEKTKKNNKTEKIKVNYECKICNFNTSKKTDYFRHLKRTKHLKNLKKLVKSSNKETEKTEFFQNEKKRERLGIDFCVCSRRFKTRSGMWKHKKICDYWLVYTHQDVSKKCFQKTPNVSNVSTPACDDSQNSVEEELNQLQIQKEKLEIEKLKKEIKNLDNPQPTTNSLTNQLVETIGKIAGNNNCNNTNNISINMYLNEQCKNAMNLEDFIKNITVSLQDLDYSTQNGYAKGIANIFIKELEDLKPTERPIHCSDKKRLQFYVKDDDKWEKDAHNIKLTNSIKNVGMEQVKIMTEWEQEHPNYMNNAEELKEWQNILENVSGGINKEEVKKNQSKIQKELGKVVDIKEELNNNN